MNHELFVAVGLVLAVLFPLFMLWRAERRR
jgi:hypothetical protein